MSFKSSIAIHLNTPLLLAIWYDKRVNKKTTDIKKNAGFCASWACGYVLMWVLKWVLAALILGRNIWKDISDQIELRVNGKVPTKAEQNVLSYIKNALVRNIKCLFPAEYGVAGLIIFLLLIAVFLYLAIVRHKEGYDMKLCLIYLIIAVIPYIRYAVLRNHSYLHCFFTYRAQFITVFALILFLEEKNSLDTINN